METMVQFNKNGNYCNYGNTPSDSKSDSNRISIISALNVLNNVNDVGSVHYRNGNPASFHQEAMKLTLIVNSALAGTMFLFEWFDGYTCGGTPPSIIYGFKLSNRDASTTTAHPGEAWPFFQRYWAPFYPAGLCGYKKAYGALKDLCCSSSVDIVATRGILSATSQYYEDADAIDTNFFPVSVNGQRYCQINQLDSNSLYGYRAVYLQSNFRCMESMKCTAAGELRVYDSFDCDGPSRTYQLTSTSTEFSLDRTIGNFTAVFSAVKDGKRVVGWTEYVPFQVSVVQLHTSMGVFVTIIVILTIIGQFALLIRMFRVLNRDPTRRSIFLCISNCFWLLFFIIVNFRKFIRLPNNKVYTTFGDYEAFLKNLVYLINSLYTGFFLISVIQLEKRGAIATYSSVLVFNFLLLGNNWFSFTYLRSGSYTSWDKFLTKWSYANDYYVPLSLLWDLAPFVVFFLWVGKLRGYSMKEWVLIVIEVDKLVPVLFISEVVLVFLYLILVTITTDSVMILGNDRNVEYVMMLRQCIIVIHASFNLLVIDRFASKIAVSDKFNRESSGISTNAL